jgi:hypothetical protein
MTIVLDQSDYETGGKTTPGLGLDIVLPERKYFE